MDGSKENSQDLTASLADDRLDRLNHVSLADKYDLGKEVVFVNGTQAVVRMCLMQAELDRQNGINSAGYVTGYRGSPLGGIDLQFAQASAALTASQVIFTPALNEDLAATAVWGTQQAALHGENTHDGVFAIWYGKGPGVDRTGDVFRHANLAGTAPKGGVLALMGDDHTGESSTVCHEIIGKQVFYSNIEMTFNYKNENEELLVYGYENEFKQVLLNLINNAKNKIVEKNIDFRKKAQIKINIERSAYYNIIEIIDDGGAIDEKIINSIFDPYFTTKETGTGFGLYMAKVIIEDKMRGIITVKNVNDTVVFTIKLPHKKVQK